MKQMSIRTRLILFLTAVLLFAFCLTNVVNYQVSRSSLHESLVSDVLPLTRDNLYSELQADLIRPIFVSSLMSNDTFVKDWLAERLSAYEKKYGGQLFFVDREGLIQAHADPIRVEHQDNIRNEAGLREVSDQFLGRKTFKPVYEYDRDGHHYLLSIRYIGELDWYLLVIKDEFFEMKAIRMNFLRNLAFGFFITCCIIVINVLTVNYFQGRLEKMATVDELTGVNNRRAFRKSFMMATYRFKRSDTPFSLMILDIDHFKQLNDSMGHLAGDRVLQGVAEICRNSIREPDTLARWGGDEFILLIEGDSRSAEAVAQRIRKQVAKQDFFPDTDAGFHVHVSCGISVYQTGFSMDDLATRADTALYEAKAAGRNATRISRTDHVA